MRRPVTLAALVAFDLGTKALASAMLSPAARIRQDAVFQLVLNVNTSGVGTWATPAMSNVPAIQMAIAGLGATALGGYLGLLPALAARGWSLLRRSLVGIAVYVGARLAGAVVIVAIGGATRTAGMVLMRIGGASLFMGLWWTAKSGIWRASATLFAAAALGNLLCLLSPPHAIVDFMYSTLVKKIFRQEIFNVADVYFDIGLVCLVLALGQWVAVRVRPGVRASGG